MADKMLAAEALAAVVGIQCILAPKPKPVTAKDGAKAVALAGKITDELRRYLSSPEFTAQDDDLPDLDYLETAEKLTREVEQPQREALLENFEDPELGLAFIDVLERGVAWLDSVLPRLSRPSLVGDIPMEPSHSEMDTFERRWLVAADPMQVFRDLAEGILITEQVEALQAMFPLLYDAICATVQRVLAELRAKDDGEWEPPLEKEAPLYTLLQTSPIDPAFAEEMQKQAEESRQEPQSQSQPLDINIKGMELPSQRLQAT